MHRIYRNRFMLVIITAVMVLSSVSNAYSPQMRTGMIGPPWELIIQNIEGDDSAIFPIEVADLNKATDMNISLPLLGSPIKIHIEKYLPSFEWTETIKQNAGPGVIVELQARGPGMNEDFMLNSEDPQRRAINSTIGGIFVKRLNDPKILKQLTSKLKNDNTIGLLSVWMKDSKVPLEFIAQKGVEISLHNTPYKLEVLQYVSHYNIDQETLQVKSLSDKPVNPAVKIRFTGDGDAKEKWLWAKFPKSPHDTTKLPVRIEFEDIDVAKNPSRYILLGSSVGEPIIAYSKDAKRFSEKVKISSPYPFAKEGYAFTITGVHQNASISRNWANASDTLKSPAIIVNVQEGDVKKQHILELNARSIHDSESGRVSLMFRRKGGSPAMPGTMPPGHGTGPAKQ